MAIKTWLTIGRRPAAFASASATRKAASVAVSQKSGVVCR
jgi:hypothetical protein